MISLPHPSTTPRPMPALPLTPVDARFRWALDPRVIREHFPPFPATQVLPSAARTRRGAGGSGAASRCGVERVPWEGFRGFRCGPKPLLGAPGPARSPAPARPGKMATVFAPFSSQLATARASVTELLVKQSRASLPGAREAGSERHVRGSIINTCRPPPQFKDLQARRPLLNKNSL